MQNLELEKIINTYFATGSKLSKILQQQMIESPEQLLHSLRAAAQARTTTQTAHHVMLLDYFDASRFSYVFSPLILSVLKHKTIFISPENQVLEQILAEYFRVEALKLNHQQALLDMDICFDLAAAELSSQELQQYAALKAALDPDCKSLIVMGNELDASLQELLQQAGIQLIQYHLVPQHFDLSEIEYKKLLWKRKSSEIASICEQITLANVDLVTRMSRMQKIDAERLIDDLMYSEHLFEKVSVFGEFTETIYKHQLK